MCEVAKYPSGIVAAAKSDAANGSARDGDVMTLSDRDLEDFLSVMEQQQVGAGSQCFDPIAVARALGGDGALLAGQQQQQQQQQQQRPASQPPLPPARSTSSDSPSDSVDTDHATLGDQARSAYALDMNRALSLELAAFSMADFTRNLSLELPADLSRTLSLELPAGLLPKQDPAPPPERAAAPAAAAAAKPAPQQRAARPAAAAPISPLMSDTELKDTAQALAAASGLPPFPLPAAASAGAVLPPTSLPPLPAALPSPWAAPLLPPGVATPRAPVPPPPHLHPSPHHLHHHHHLLPPGGQPPVRLPSPRGGAPVPPTPPGAAPGGPLPPLQGLAPRAPVEFAGARPLPGQPPLGGPPLRPRASSMGGGHGPAASNAADALGMAAAAAAAAAASAAAASAAGAPSDDKSSLLLLGPCSSHSTVEKQRRDRLNHLIDELCDMVPPADPKYGNEGGSVRRPKHVVLSDTIMMIRKLQAQLKGAQAQVMQLAAQAVQATAAAEAAASAAGAAAAAAEQQQQQQTAAAGSSVVRCSAEGTPELPAAPEINATGVVVEQGNGCLLVKVNCRDRKGLLGDLVAALKSFPLVISSAAITTTREGKVHDVFEVQLEADSGVTAEDVQCAIHTALYNGERLRGKRSRHF